jgi:hypothetical protein
VFDMRPESFELFAKRLELTANRMVLGARGGFYRRACDAAFGLLPAGMGGLSGCDVRSRTLLRAGHLPGLEHFALRLRLDSCVCTKARVNSALRQQHTLASMATGRALFHKFAFCRIALAGAEIGQSLR